jgi:hypothetical protein
MPDIAKLAAQTPARHVSHTAELAIFPLPERLKDREWWQVWIGRDGVRLNCDHHREQQSGQAQCRYGDGHSEFVFAWKLPSSISSGRRHEDGGVP